MEQLPLPEDILPIVEKINEDFGVRAYPATTSEGGWVIEVVIPEKLESTSDQIRALARPYEIRFVGPNARVIVPY